MRHNAEPPSPWPQLAAEYFEAEMSIARICLAALARAIATPEENLTDKMMDPPGKELVGVSSSIFRFFHYFDGAARNQLGCLSHTDIGLITLIPVTNSPALEILDEIDYRWRAYEKELKPGDMMVLCGETLERLTAYYYPAVV